MDSEPTQSSSMSTQRTDWLAVCEATSPALYAWARLRLRTYGVQTLAPEDVVQETWARALAATEARGALPSTNLRGWLFGIAQNVLLEATRARAARTLRAARNGEHASDLVARCEDTVTSLCTRLERDETVERFFALAEGLDATDRALLVGCAFEGATASDVGRRLDLAPDTAIKRWQRLRESLRAHAFAERLGLDG